MSFPSHNLSHSKTSKGHGLLFSLLATSALFSIPTFADGKSVAKDKEIEEIVITGSYIINNRLDIATGLGLSLQETPQSVSVMTYQRLEDQNLRSLTDVVKNAVGVSAKEYDSSRSGFSARGFAIENYQVDGVPLAWSPSGDSGETQADTTLYERVEIVRGATGLLTGAGDPSASINLVRKHANSDTFKGQVSVDGGSWGSFGISTDIVTPLNASGSIRGRIVASYRDDGSFRDLGGNKKLVLYGVLEADITEATLLRLGASYQDNDPTASTWGGLSPWYSDGTRTEWDRSKTVAADWTYWASTNKNYFLNLIHDFDNGWQAKLNLNKSENTTDLALLYLYGAPDNVTGLGLGAFPYNSDGSSKQDSIDFQLKGTFSLFGRDHELVLGALHSKQKFDVGTYAALTFPAVGDFNAWDGSYPQPAWSDTRSPAENYSTTQTGFYGASRINVSNNFKVILGGRLADWKQEGISYGSDLDYGDSGVFIPYAGALYTIAEQHTAYISYTEIFQPQSSQDRNGDFLAPLTGKSYELGLKSTFLDDAVQTTASIFLIEQDNLAQPDTGYLIPGTIFPASRAAQGTESKGFEFEVAGELSPGWNLSLGYTQFKAEDAAGNKVNTSHPRKLLKLFTTYRLPENWDKLTIGGGINWESSNYTDATNPATGNSEPLEQKAYALVSLMARYDVSSEISLQLNVDNLLDETYYSQIGFFSQLAYGAPRNFSLKARYSF